MGANVTDAPLEPAPVNMKQTGAASALRAAHNTRIARVAFVVPDALAVLNQYSALAAAVRRSGDLVRCFALP